MRSLFAAGMVAASVFLAPSTNAAVLYQNDFESGVAGAAISGVTSIFGVPTGGTSAGNYYLAPLSAGGTSTATIGTGGASSLTIAFDLYVLNSMDGNGSYCCGPDYFTLKVNGTTIFSETFASSAGWIQSFGGLGNPSGNYAGGTGSDPLLTGVFGHEYYGPSRGYHLTFTIAGVGPTAAIAFIGNSSQGWSDEGFGIDNIKVTGNITSGVPEPATWAMMLIGFAGLGYAARRRRRAV